MMMMMMMITYISHNNCTYECSKINTKYTRHKLSLGSTVVFYLNALRTPSCRYVLLLCSI